MHIDILISIYLRNLLYFGLTSDMNVLNTRGKNRLRQNFDILKPLIISLTTEERCSPRLRLKSNQNCFFDSRPVLTNWSKLIRERFAEKVLFTLLSISYV